MSSDGALSRKFYLLEDDSTTDLTSTRTHIKLARNDVDLSTANGDSNKIFVTIESLVSEKLVNEENQWTSSGVDTTRHLSQQ